MVMTSSMTSQSDLKVVSLYSFMNEKIKFFMITEDLQRYHLQTKCTYVSLNC